jgi:glycosyltransferase involved in cell wall biosynthesis
MKIHVLHVLNSAHGGSAISTFEMIVALKKQGVISSVVCFNNATEQQQQKISILVEGRALFIPLYWMNKKIRSTWWKRPALELLGLWRTWAGHRYQKKIDILISKGGVNVIHTSTILNREGAIAAKRNQLPHVWHVRELIGPLKYFQFYDYQKLSKYLTSHASAIIANSKTTKACLGAYLPEDKILVIPNSVDVSNFSIKNHANGKKLVVAMVGNVTSRLKNHQFFISVAGKLKEQPNVEFRVYGALPREHDLYYESLCNSVKENGLEGKFTFVNFKELPEEIMAEIDILFHPTENESFGRIFIEAMAAGIPVVGMKEGGSRDMIKDGINGHLIGLNVEEAHGCLLKLINDSQLRTRLGLNGRKLVEEEYSIAQMTNRLIQVYQDVSK